MLRDDETTLDYMIKAAINSQQIATGRSRDDFDKDMVIRFALIYSVQTIGECASKMSLTVRQSNPQIPWRNMIGMRNILVHSFFAIDHSVFWNVVTVEIPELLENLRRIDIENAVSHTHKILCKIRR